MALRLPRLRTRQAIGLVGVVVIGTPLAFGGAPAQVVPVAALLAAVALFVTGADRATVARDPMLPAFGLLLGVGALQLLPLPPWLLTAIDPVSAEASARVWHAWGVDLSHTWRPLHYDPGTGWSDAVYLLGLASLYLATKRLSMRDGLTQVYLLCAASALVVASLGLAHLLIGQDRVYGVYAPVHAAPPVLSPVLNANHLAALMGAGAILWIGLAVEAPRGVGRVLHGVAAVLCGAVCALSLSRGGVAAAAGGVALLVALLGRRPAEGLVGRREARGSNTFFAVFLGAAVIVGGLYAATTSLATEYQRGGVAAAVGGVALLVALLGRRPAEGLVGRREVRGSNTFFAVFLGAAVIVGGLYAATTSLATEYQRGDATKLENFRRALGLLRGHELLGVGSGGVTAAVAATGRLDPDWTFLRVESLPLDLVLAVGLVAGSLVMALGVRALARWFPPVHLPATTLAAWCALVSLIVHDLVDFALHLGAVGYLAAALAGLLAGHHARGWKKSPVRAASVSRGPLLLLVALVASLGWVARRSPLETDRDALELALRADRRYYRSREARAVLRRHPFDAYAQLLVGAYALTDRDPAALRFVNRSLILSPNWAQPHLLLARSLAARGLRSQALLEVREAITRSRYAVRHAVSVVGSLDPPPTLDELEAMAPAGEHGTWFLELMAQTPGRSPATAAAADTAHLRRDPQAPGALLRRATAARTAGDLAAAWSYCDRLIRAAPRSAAAYVCAGEIAARAGDAPNALRILEAALARVDDRYPIHAERARLFARQREAPAMRREITAMLDAAGADIARIVTAHANRGQYEADLGNDRLAYEAYEQAEALSVPEHPYTLSLAQIAVRLGDRAGVEAACAVLMERSPPEPGAAELCVRGARASNRVAPALRP